MKTTTIKLFLLCLFLGITSCSSNDSNEDENVNPEKNSYDYYVNTTMQKAIDDLGITIHKGLTPPNVEGVYTIDPLRCTMSNFNDGYLGVSLGASLLTLSNQNTAKLCVDFKNFTIYSYDTKTETWEGKGSFISGEANKFSVLLHSEGELKNNNLISKYQNLIILSGELDKVNNEIKGIKNVQLASIMSDDYGDPNKTLIEIGQGRLFTNSYASIR
ncbi:hypothetical protein [Flavobacterium johnsoniae]|uniref:Lipoprotein n=1 Tax=Flavobacterium johnsoniae TaxID=986 RepID=A0A1J7BRN9_FLAJO|nr:hypothetical protein [Flavobacterium johnsoniae]OIV41371.1 hypothetical protein BKM63_12565 [Flavobacterium johnsoniae]